MDRVIALESLAD